MVRNKDSKTKIIATIGPACASYEILREMFRAGIDVCRLNFSHGSYEFFLQIIQLIRQLNEELRMNVAILGDLQGPKLRIGEVENNRIDLKEGDEITFVTEPCVGNREKLYITYREFPSDTQKGEYILLDDGKIRMKVIDTNGRDTVRASVVNGGSLSSKKGVNLPDTKVSLPSLTDKDKKDAEFMLQNNFDWIALSFVRSADDIKDLRDFIKARGKETGIIAKIEKPEALDELDSIIAVTDGVMVARGDLGVEIAFNKVPYIQKQIVSKCIAQAKPVIIATQMLESMIANFRPTRAEANDVANAVFDAADTLMLSGETSVGKYPLEAIKSMQRVINSSEGRDYTIKHEHLPLCNSSDFLPDSVCYNAVKMANLTGAKAIITYTHSGATAYKISSYRPTAHIFAFTSSFPIVKSLSLVWGIRAFYMKHVDHINEAVSKSIEILKKEGLILPDDIVVHVGSIPMSERGKTNMMKISYVK
ncbi:MAG: pyruvate kinase [Bacteroidales bacterium]|nr:pyruvate kinase [Bacteroidales bacterium]